MDDAGSTPARIEPVWAAPVLLAAVAACLTARVPIPVVALVAVALVPWALGLAGRRVPDWLFGVLGVLPVAAIVALEDLDASIFLAMATLAQLASRAGRPWRIVAAIAVGALLPFVSVLGGWPFDPGAIYFAIGDQFGVVLGLLLARTRRLAAELRDADARLAAASAAEERTRLARDVHDLVAHSLTVVVLQVGGARRVLRTDPDRAAHALEQAERVGRESLDGIREVVGLLRAGDEPATASLDLGRLVETYRAAQVPVDLEVDERIGALPLLVRGALFRVVREALANAARYRAPGTPVSVRVGVEGEGVVARVANDGRPAGRAGPGGFGLTGLREQVAELGGTLESGPADGGWTVRCRLPADASVRVA